MICTSGKKKGQTVSNLIRDIEKTKKRLIARAKKQGLYENFGDKEVRELEERYSKSIIIPTPILEFFDWCNSFDLNDLRLLEGKQ